MQRRRPLRRTTISLGVTLALGLGLAGCSGKTVAGPTPTGFISVQGGSATAGAAATAGSAWGPTNVSWSCFTGGMLGSLGDCPTPRWTANDVQVGAIITAPPTNLQRLVSGSTINLSWTAPPAPNQPTSYVIEAGTGPGLSNITTFNTGNAQTTLTVSTVPNGSYFVRVRARDAAGNGPASNEVNVVVGGPGPGPCTGPPGTPTNLGATAIGSTIALYWSEPSSGCEPDSFVILVGSAPGQSNLAQVDTGIPVTSFSVSGVQAGTYYVRVRARIGSTLGAVSNEVVLTVTGVVPPGTTTWVGLVANGDGLTITNDRDCGFMQIDLTLTLVPSGNSVTGLRSFTIRVAQRCPEAAGFRDSAPIQGTVTGSFASGSGTISATTASGETVTFNGTFANGRMTGSTSASDGPGTFAVNRQ